MHGLNYRSDLLLEPAAHADVRQRVDIGLKQKLTCGSGDPCVDCGAMLAMYGVMEQELLQYDAEQPAIAVEVINESLIDDHNPPRTEAHWPAQAPAKH